MARTQIISSSCQREDLQLFPCFGSIHPFIHDFPQVISYFSLGDNSHYPENHHQLLKDLTSLWVTLGSLLPAAQSWALPSVTSKTHNARLQDTEFSSGIVSSGRLLSVLHRFSGLQGSHSPFSFAVSASSHCLAPSPPCGLQQLSVTLLSLCLCLLQQVTFQGVRSQPVRGLSCSISSAFCRFSWTGFGAAVVRAVLGQTSSLVPRAPKSPTRKIFCSLLSQQ